MRLPYVTMIAAMLAVGTTVTTAQDRVARSPSASNQTIDANVSQGQAAIDRAAAANKYIFLYFWRDKDSQTDKAWSVFEAATAKLANAADIASIQITNPDEKQLVNKYGVSRSPMPLVLAVAPNGAVTKGFPKQFDENQLRAAFVSPCTAACMKALQDQKIVLLCIEHLSPQETQVSLQKGVLDFTKDAQYAKNSSVVVLNANDPAETSFLKDLHVDPKANSQITVLMAPPAAVVGTFVGKVSEAELVAKLNSAKSLCCPGGKCSPKK